MKCFLCFLGIFGMQNVFAKGLSAFALIQEDGSEIVGYFLPPENPYFPIFIAIQSADKEALSWGNALSDKLPRGVGCLVLESQGESLQERCGKYLSCLNQLSCIYPVQARMLFLLGESEGSLVISYLAEHLDCPTACRLLLMDSDMNFYRAHHLPLNGFCDQLFSESVYPCWTLLLTAADVPASYCNEEIEQVVDKTCEWLSYSLLNMGSSLLAGSGEVSLGTKGSKDSDGNEKRSVEGSLGYKGDRGDRVEMKVERKEERDREGNRKSETSAELRYTKPFDN
ncbi:MAG: hypothetical protein FJZ58_04005 [Chlamydiae bacterium]|nr:hypothetical protein [Chlamydiota bacterium]